MEARSHTPDRRRPAAASFTLQPFAKNPAVWGRFAAAHPDAALYHREEWIELLRRAYGLKFLVAAVEDQDGVRAACVLARSRRPFSRRLVALPFSDFCYPLAMDAEAMVQLLDGLANHWMSRGGLELRGVGVNSPWQTIACFENWTLDMRRSADAIECALGGVLRRKLQRNLRSATAAGVNITRGFGLEHIRRFYALQLESRQRLGLPAQPMSFFRLAHQIFAGRRQIEVWLASVERRDVAGLVLLRDRDRLYEKWSARSLDAPVGAGHLLLWNVIEEFAGDVEVLDLGRADVRNIGLRQFKKSFGGVESLLPYAFFPIAPNNISAEVPGPMQRIFSRVWRRLPLPATRMLGGAIYGYLS